MFDLCDWYTDDLQDDAHTFNNTPVSNKAVVGLWLAIDNNTTN